jgi:hypothetical protein
MGIEKPKVPGNTPGRTATTHLTEPEVEHVVGHEVSLDTNPEADTRG